MSVMSLRRFFSIALPAVFCGLLAVSASAQDAQKQVQAHLDAGEFGPAQQLANQVNGQLRDQLLANIAAAQARAGARRASLSTLSSMSDDRLRSSAVGLVGSQPAQAFTGRGGQAQADFDSLIELITSTIKPDTWEEVGGPGAVEEFPGGVYVDSAGLLKKLAFDTDNPALAGVRARSADLLATGSDLHKKSQLRKVSLNRLEREIQKLAAIGKEPTDAMRSLAGIYDLQYVFVYPETGDIVLAGPAGKSHRNQEGRVVNSETGKPALQLDDLVVMLRNAQGEAGGRFTCSITPRRENLARTQEYLAKNPGKPLQTQLGKIRELLGRQDIEVAGLDPRTRAARAIVEADYRMKLVGMGLEDGVLGVESYLRSIKLAPGQDPPSMNVLRWWFTLNYNAVFTTDNRDAFELRGQGVKVLSENEMLTERGERVHTGKSDRDTAEFAHSFTKHFEALADKYPIYAELRNIFDLALVAGIIRSEDLAGQTGWHMSWFLNPENYQVELDDAPTEVDTVINHRTIVDKKFKRKHVIAGVSGGISVDFRSLVSRDAVKVDDYGKMEAGRIVSVPKKLSRDAWWWD